MPPTRQGIWLRNPGSEQQSPYSPSDKRITTIITTINRPTLANAIESVGNHPFIIVSDGMELSTDMPYVRLGMRHGNYGCAAFNVGVALATTEYITKLDDDDEFLPGALDIMTEAINKDEADIWIPGLRYSDGSIACMEQRVVMGQVACPTIRTRLAVLHPIRPMEPSALLDVAHVQALVYGGASIRWYGRPLIAVRPKLTGKYGMGA